MISDGIDHLIVTAADLKSGMDHIEKKLGVRPEPGGRHSEFGTHNALLSLGSATYLEIISPDPNTVISRQKRLFSEHFSQKPKLTTWVYRTQEITIKADKAKQAGIDVGNVSSGSRETTNGQQVRWKLTNPYKMLCDGAVPFLINWGETLHPAQSAPAAGELLDFHIEHPDPDEVKKCLTVLGINVPVRFSKKVRLVASIATELGRVDLS
jgi:hypothetical protein